MQWSFIHHKEWNAICRKDGYNWKSSHSEIRQMSIKKSQNFLIYFFLLNHVDLGWFIILIELGHFEYYVGALCVFGAISLCVYVKN